MNYEVIKMLMFGLESDFYESMKDSDIAEKVIKQFPGCSFEKLSELLATGMNRSKCGDAARTVALNHKFLPNYDEICKKAFKNVMIRLLTEYQTRNN